jgi:hypothetical protein
VSPSSLTIFRRGTRQRLIRYWLFATNEAASLPNRPSYISVVNDADLLFISSLR